MQSPEELIASRWEELPGRVLGWYDTAARDLPWRVGPAARRAGETADPYRVWLSEIMLQQTTVPHGMRYFLEFTRRWPTVEDLAGADDADVMAAWAGLGYYARARNLLKCAREVVARGGFPETAAELRTLPGVGAYTAGAVAAIAFGERAAAVDGNVDRVFARLLALKGEWKTEKKRLVELVSALVPGDRPGEFAEALMDLGATICTPRSPNCLICPLSDLCTARSEGGPERYPVKPAKTPKPTRRGAVFVLVDGEDFLVERRPDKGLLGGMLGLPGTEWRDSETDGLATAAGIAPVSWARVGEVRHVFTHFSLELEVWRGEGRADGEWLAIDRIADLPSVFQKAAKLALLDQEERLR